MEKLFSPVLMLPSMKLHWYDKPGPAQPIWDMVETVQLKRMRLAELAQILLSPGVE